MDMMSSTPYDDFGRRILKRRKGPERMYVKTGVTVGV
jgi:hypothetical protein